MKFLLTMFALTFGAMMTVGCQESGDSAPVACEICEGICPCADADCNCETDCTCSNCA